MTILRSIIFNIVGPLATFIIDKVCLNKFKLHCHKWLVRSQSWQIQKCVMWGGLNYQIVIMITYVVTAYRQPQFLNNIFSPVKYYQLLSILWWLDSGYKCLQSPTLTHEFTALSSHMTLSWILMRSGRFLDQLHSSVRSTRSL